MSTATSPIPEPLGWQAQKSAATRTQIVESAIKCFVELGYAQTTTTAIAEQAGLSRGAMLHHFPAKSDVVRAAVDHLHGKRLKAFRKALQRPPEDGDWVRQAVQAYWSQVRHPLFVAFFELSVAARTDAELAAILLPAQQAFDREWYRTAEEVLPRGEGGAERGERFRLALDLSRYVLEGMALHFPARRDADHVERMLRYVESQLRVLFGAVRADRAPRETSSGEPPSP